VQHLRSVTNQINIFVYFSRLTLSTKRNIFDSKCDIGRNANRFRACFACYVIFFRDLHWSSILSLAFVFLVSSPLRIECFEECNPPDCTPIFYKWRSRFTGLSSLPWAGTSRRTVGYYLRDVKNRHRGQSSIIAKTHSGGYDERFLYLEYDRIALFVLKMAYNHFGKFCQMCTRTFC